MKREFKFLSCIVCVSSLSITNAQNLTLHYNCPANYFEESFVIGNGKIGAILYCGTQEEKISLNDITLWTGEPDTTVTTPDAHKAIPLIRELLNNEDYRNATEAQKKSRVIIVKTTSR